MADVKDIIDGNGNIDWGSFKKTIDDFVNSDEGQKYDKSEKPFQELFDIANKELVDKGEKPVYIHNQPVILVKDNNGYSKDFIDAVNAEKTNLIDNAKPFIPLYKQPHMSKNPITPSLPPFYHEKAPTLLNDVCEHSKSSKDVIVYSDLGVVICELRNYFRSDVSRMFVYSLFKNRIVSIIQGMNDLNIYANNTGSVVLNVLWHLESDTQVSKLIGGENEIAESWELVKKSNWSKKKKSGFHNSQIVYVVDDLKQVEIYQWGWKILSNGGMDLVGVFPGFSQYGNNFDDTFTSNQIKLEVNECVGEEFELPHSLAMSELLIGYWTKNIVIEGVDDMLSEKGREKLYGQKSFDFLDI